MECEVFVVAIPASWEEKGYFLAATTQKDPTAYPLEEGPIVAQATISCAEPTRAQLVAAKIASLRATRKTKLDEVNRDILEIDNQIQNLLALEA